jgi:hypothetical protein
MLTYKRFDNLEMLGYSDADFVGCVDTKKSTSGYIFTLAEGAISWKSTKQSVTVCKLNLCHAMRQPGRRYG